MIPHAHADGGDGVESPCVRRCCLDAQDICLGCLRSMEEIMRWPNASAEERAAILLSAEQRREYRAALAAGEPG